MEWRRLPHCAARRTRSRPPALLCPASNGLPEQGARVEDPGSRTVVLCKLSGPVSRAWHPNQFAGRAFGPRYLPGTLLCALGPPLFVGFSGGGAGGGSVGAASAEFPGIKASCPSILSISPDGIRYFL